MTYSFSSAPLSNASSHAFVPARCGISVGSTVRLDVVHVDMKRRSTMKAHRCCRNSLVVYSSTWHR